MATCYFLNSIRRSGRKRLGKNTVGMTTGWNTILWYLTAKQAKELILAVILDDAEKQWRNPLVGSRHLLPYDQQLEDNHIR